MEGILIIYSLYKIDNLSEGLSKLQISEDKTENINKKYIPPHKRKEINDLKIKSDETPPETDNIDKSNITKEEESREKKSDDIKPENKPNDTSRKTNRPKVNVSAMNRVISFQLGNQLTKEQRSKLREQAKAKEIKIEKKLNK